MSTQQKVVSVYLNAWDRKHGTGDELLHEELAQGWRVVQITSAGGAPDPTCVGVWVIFVLEKPAASGA